jgi:hypothetical protein
LLFLDDPLDETPERFEKHIPFIPAQARTRPWAAISGFPPRGTQEMQSIFGVPLAGINGKTITADRNML